MGIVPFFPQDERRDDVRYFTFEELKYMARSDTTRGCESRASRRRFIGQGTVAAVGAAAGLALPASWLLAAADGAQPARQTPRLKSKTLLVASPEPGTVVWAQTYYTQAKGLEKVCVMSRQRRSDVFEDLQRRFSPDNGKTWSAWEPIKRFKEKTPQGMHRQYPHPGWIDPANGRMLVMLNDGVLPTDDPLEGMTHWSLRYRVSSDGGRTFAVDEPVVQKGDYSPEHPLEGVWIGKNGVMIGATTCRPIRTRQGLLLVPICISPLGPDGRYWRPGGGYTYHDAAVLIGRWSDGQKIEWELSERVVADPAKSTRGCDEPTLAEMPDGRILMVIRGSNDVKRSLPAYKWYCTSSDGGRHWSNPPKPWTYSDGAAFFSPASCSQLLRHSNGKCYWIGNISAENPRGNMPRFPLVIGEVDPTSLLLVRESIAAIDTRGPDDDESLQLSNFLAYEDRADGTIALDVTRMMTKPPPWRGDAYTYRIEP
jgi:hypothetical protein